MHNNISGYRDIIDLPHRVSETRMPMTIHARAAQFAPFAALMGYEDAIDETARLVDGKVELSEDEIAELNRKFARLLQILDECGEYPEVEITYFVPDERKNGGAYVTKAVRVKSLDGIFHKVILSDRTEIDIADILSLEIM